MYAACIAPIIRLNTELFSYRKKLNAADAVISMKVLMNSHASYQMGPARKPRVQS